MRTSNIELLRIASMMMIIMFHFSVHGSWPDAGELASDVAVNMLSFGGKLGVNCFVLITGYFAVSGRPKLQSVLRVVLETWFYSYLILGIFLVAQPDLVTPEKLRRAVIPLCSGEYWFITCYVAMMLASPFLNVLWRHLGARGKTCLMALGFIVLSVVPTLATFNPIGSDLVWFFYLYLLGGWVREQREARRANDAGGEAAGAAEPEEVASNEPLPLCLLDPLRLVGKITPLGAFIGGVAFVWLSMGVIEWAHAGFGFSIIKPDYLIWQYMTPTFIASLGLLVAFTRLNIPSLPFVNTVARTTLGIYLIHDNPIMRAWLWPHFAWIYHLGPAAILAFGVLSAAVVFAPCSLIDWLRITLLERPLFAFINKRWGKPLQKAQEAIDALAGDTR